VKVFVGSGDKPHIDPDGFITADALKLPLLQDAQQLGLCLQLYVADFVQKKRSFVGQLEFSRLFGRGAGKGSFFMTEELALQQTGRDGHAIELDKRFPLPVALLINRFREKFFSHTAFTQQKDRIVCRRYFDDLAQATPDGPALADDSGKPISRIHFADQIGYFTKNVIKMIDFIINLRFRFRF